MKNIFGTTEELRLTDENGALRYMYNKIDHYTYDSNGNILTYRSSDGYSAKYTYNSMGNELTREDSDGNWNKLTYDSEGNLSTVENSPLLNLRSQSQSEYKI
jgi:YD repeat-containing protein